MNDEQTNKIMAGITRLAEAHQTLNVVIKNIVRDIENIKIKLNIIDVTPKVKKLAGNFIPKIFSDIDKIEHKK